MPQEFQGNKLTWMGIGNDGSLEIFSKTPLEGYVEKRNAKDELKGYVKKYAATDVGLFTELKLEDNKYIKGLKELIIGIGDDRVKVPYKTDKGQISDYAKSLANVLPNIDFNKEYSISPSKATKPYQGRNVLKYRSFFVNDTSGDSVDNAHPYPTRANPNPPNGLPSPTKKMVYSSDEKKEVPQWDYTEQSNFLLRLLDVQIERFEKHKGVVSETPQKAAPAKSDAPADDDDLPF